MSIKKLRVIDPEMTRERRLEIGLGVLKQRDSLGWSLLLDFFDTYEDAALHRGIQDTGRPREYYQGYLQAINDIRGSFEELEEEAKNHLLEEEEARHGITGADEWSPLGDGPSGDDPSVG